MSNPVVGIVMGSQSDWPTLKHAQETLKNLGIVSEAKVLSAHRQPVALETWVTGLEGRGFKVVIAGAGMAAALPGVVAARTRLPVLGVPMESKLDGLDSILSMVQMPAGIPVGTLAVGRAGAVNAALLSAAILALSDPKVATSLNEFRAKQSNASETPQDPA
jgi:5-(carboxyamino)imidazole ribonucleotide mutase